MSKRLTDTEKWERPWFRNLPTLYKLLWCYVLDKCDLAGVWYVDFELVNFFLGKDIYREEAERLFLKQIVVNGDRWLIKDFIQFQYGKLMETNKLHGSVAAKLLGFNNGALMGDISPINGVNVKVKVNTLKDNPKKLNKSNNNVFFEEFYKAYPKHKGRAAALRAWEKLNPDESLRATILRAVAIQSKSEDWTKDKGTYVPHPASWLNGHRWEDEVQSSYEKPPLTLEQKKKAEADYAALIERERKKIESKMAVATH